MTYFQAYRLDKTVTYLTNLEGEEYEFCQRIEVTDVYTNILTGDKKVNICITSTQGSVNVLIDRALLVGDVLSVLCKKGLQVSQVREYVVTVTELLMETEANATQHLFHESLGFHKDVNGKLRFLSAESLGRKNCSRHIDYERYKSKGSYDEWLVAVKPFVDNRPELQVAVLLGLTAPVASILNMMHVMPYMPIYALIGASSTGKTTALRLMCSMWCRPSANNGGIDLLTDTDNYLLGSLALKNGYPHFFDDTSTMPDKDFTKLIYTIASSKERGRCKADGTLRPKRSWSGAAYFTGEQSMLSYNSNLTGRNARIIEFNLPWTADAESAEALNSVCNRYYGTAHEVFVKHVMSKGGKDIKNTFQELLNGLAEKYDVKDGVQRRQVQLLALVLVTLKYAAEVVDFNYDVDAINAILEAAFRENSEPESEAQILYDVLMQKIAVNKSMFPTKNMSKYECFSAWGEDGTYNNSRCYWVLSTKFTEFLAEAGYKDVKYAVKLLQSAGYLIKFVDRFRIKHRIRGVDVMCYALYQNNSASSTTVGNSKRSKVNRKKVKRQVETLIRVDEDECDD